MAVTTRLLLESNMVKPELHEFANGQACIYSCAAPGKGEANEDGAALLPWGVDSGALAIADGLGGHSGGAQASAVALGSLAEVLARGREAGVNLRDAILDGMEQANRKVSELGIGAGTTLAVVELSAGSVRSYHVGDSMILVTGQRGRSKLQTVPHSPVGYAVESGYLDAEEAMHHADRHIVFNMVGSADMRIEVGPPVQLARFDTLLLASDGLADNMHAQEIIDDVRIGPIESAGERLVNTCRQRMLVPTGSHPSKADDMSFIVFRPGRR